MRFRYLHDPVFLVSLFAYLANRWIIKPLVPGGFFHAHLNDLLCIPLILPVMLWGMRLIGARRDDAPPRLLEILIPTIVWSLLFEFVLPPSPASSSTVVPETWLSEAGRGMTADVRDIAYYLLGAFVATAFWQVWYRPRRLDSAVAGRADCRPIIIARRRLRESKR